MDGGILLFHCYLFKSSVKRRKVLTVQKWDFVKDRKCVKGEGNKWALKNQHEGTQKQIK